MRLIKGHISYCISSNRALSEVPNSETIAGVRIGLIDDKFVVNPTNKEMEGSILDLLVAGTDSAILMIEVNCYIPTHYLCFSICCICNPSVVWNIQEFWA